MITRMLATVFVVVAMVALYWVTVRPWAGSSATMPEYAFMVELNI